MTGENVEFAGDRSNQAKAEVVLPQEPAFAHLSVREYLALYFVRRPRRAFERLFAEGRVRSVGRPVAAGRRVGELSDLTVVGGLDDLPEIYCGGEGGGISILHEDERLIALSKDSGRPVVPDRHGARQSCLGFLLSREIQARREKPLAEYYRPRIVHRIDRLTSGLVLVARSAEVERKLGEYFEQGAVRKEYLALLTGVVEPVRVTVDCPVAPGRKGKMRAASPGKPATSEFEVVDRFGEHTLCVVRPKSGRTHQIRVHAYAAGHPVAGDPLYGRGGEAPALGRLALHAWKVGLPEGWPGARDFTCPLAEDFRRTLDRLARSSHQTP
ncbi:MAG: RluA family pseudouridine synthase [Planctomycetota bacterium]|nr:RluA family pseudouridine synthase [Planctomycetota bacterium]